MRDYIDRTQRDGTPNDVRRRRMNKVNPKYVLRNYQAQLAIDKAKERNNSVINRLLEFLQYSYYWTTGLLNNLANKRIQ